MNNNVPGIVVLDDNATYLASISGILGSRYRLKSFSSSKMLIDYLSLNPADLLVMSANLKEDYSFLVMLEVSERWPKLPIVITTDCSMQYLRITMNYREITEGVVWMPVSADHLLEVIDQALSDPVATSDS